MGDAIAALLALDEAAARGSAPSTAELAHRQKRWLEPQLEDLLTELKSLHWVHMTREGGWALARRLSDATLMDLYATRVFDLPCPGDPDWPADERLVEVLTAGNAGLKQALDVPLAAFRLQRAEAVTINRPKGEPAGDQQRNQ
jgi:hypothetical protein